FPGAGLDYRLEASFRVWPATSQLSRPNRNRTSEQQIKGWNIGAPGFEPGTSPTRTVRATRLRHAPRAGDYPRLGRLLADRFDRGFDLGQARPVLQRASAARAVDDHGLA